MRRVRPNAPGRRPDARRQRSLPVLRYATGAHVLGMRPAAHRCRNHRCRPGLRLVLPGSAAAMRTLRADPQDRQAGDGIRSRPVLQLLQGRSCGLLGLREFQALPADLLGKPDLPHLPDPPSPAMFPVRTRPPGPGGMARRAGLCRLLRACPPPPRRVRRLPGGAAADRPRRGGKAGLRPVRRSSRGWTTPAGSAAGEGRSTAAGAAPAVYLPNAPGSCSPVPAGKSPSSCIPCSRHSARSRTLPPW